MKPFARSLALVCLIGWASLTQAAETLTLWFHGATNPNERAVLQQLIAAFNASQGDWAVTLQPVPRDVYGEAVAAAAQAGGLPDILDVELSNLPNWVWAGYLQPLALDPQAYDDLLPGARGLYRGKLYGLGLWDSPVALMTRASTLETLKLRRPTLDQPWTGAEFDAALKAAKESGRFKYAFDPGMAWKGAWPAYAFVPLLRSFGGDLLDSAGGAAGRLDGPAAVAWGQWWQHLFTQGYAQATQEPGDRDGGFMAGDYAFSLNGVWAAQAARQAFPDAVFLPLPDFGQGAQIRSGSWQFAVSASSDHAEGAARFIAFALQDRFMADFAMANGLVPARASAAALVPAYQAGRPLAEFAAFARREGVAYPASPGYGFQAAAFEQAASALAAGGEVQDLLSAAAQAIDADLARNRGYLSR